MVKKPKRKLSPDTPAFEQFKMMAKTEKLKKKKKDALPCRESYLECLLHTKIIFKTNKTSQ
jgi:hypothetical protein